MSWMDDEPGQDRTPIVQCRLIQGDKEMTCWLEKFKKLKPGVRVTLKGIEGWWDLQNVYTITMQRGKLHLNSYVERI